MTVWLCRAGKHGEYENKFIEENRIYCTWDNLPVSLHSFSERKDLFDYFTDQEEVKDKTATNWVSQVWPFGFDMQVGDWVMLPSKVNPVINVGKITSDYRFQDEATIPFKHFREVDWFKKAFPGNYLTKIFCIL